MGAELTVLGLVAQGTALIQKLLIEGNGQIRRSGVDKAGAAAPT